jgi:FtsZ-binding cell division protein ZapB
MSDIVNAVISSGVGAASAMAVLLVGQFLTRRQRERERNTEQTEAAAALRFEVASNLKWADDIFDTRNYLRDEAWCNLKNKGYITYLKKPIPARVIDTYNNLHRLNYWIYVLKEKEQSLSFEEDKACRARKDFLRDAQSLIDELDLKYPDMARNFR